MIKLKEFEELNDIPIKFNLVFIRIFIVFRYSKPNAVKNIIRRMQYYVIDYLKPNTISIDKTNE